MDESIPRLRRSALSPLNQRFRWDQWASNQAFRSEADLRTSMARKLPGFWIRLKK